MYGRQYQHDNWWSQILISLLWIQSNLVPRCLEPGNEARIQRHHNAKNISLLGTLSCGNVFCNWISWYLLSFSQYHPFLTNTLHTHMRMRLPVSMWQTCTTNLHFNNAAHMLYINPQGQPPYHFYHVVVHTLHSTQREVSKAAGRGKHFQGQWGDYYPHGFKGVQRAFRS